MPPGLALCEAEARSCPTPVIHGEIPKLRLQQLAGFRLASAAMQEIRD